MRKKGFPNVDKVKVSNMIRARIKALLPDRPVPTRILAGPFRGARLRLDLRCSLRKVFGIYEQELNAWLRQALAQVDRVLDVGANDGYFTFGTAAAFRRAGKDAEIIAFDPDPTYVERLRQGIADQQDADISFEVIPASVGNKHCPSRGFIALDSLPVKKRCNTLIKVDVEGAEVDVIEGARSWIEPSNWFLVEVHGDPMFEQVSRIFFDHQHPLRKIVQRPLRVLGAETRSNENCWLVSSVSQGLRGR
jgi:hypothetical protein